MSDFIQLALDDATSPTPVTRPFDPARIDTNGVAHWEDRTDGVYAGYGKASLGVTRPSGPANSGTRNVKCRIKLILPKVDTDGVVLYTNSIDCVHTISTLSVEQERKDLRALWRQIYVETAVINALEKYEAVFG